MAKAFSRTTRSLQRDGSRWAYVTWTVAVLGLFVWSLWFFGGRVSVVEVSQQAKLQAWAVPYWVVSDVTGKVLQSQLQLGKPVQAGDVVVQLDASALALQSQEERVRLEAMGLRLQALQGEILALQQAQQSDRQATVAALQTAQARHQEARATADLARETAQRMAAERGVGSVAEIEALRAGAEFKRQSAVAAAAQAEGQRVALEAQTRQHQGQAQLEALRRAQVTLEGEVQTVQTTLKRLEREMARYTLKAPVAGTVAEVSALSPGAFVTAGEKLATVVPAGEVLIVADFNPTTALGRLKPGQRAQLRLDGFSWVQYGVIEARVLRVASATRETPWLRAELAIVVQPALPAQTQALLQHGLSGSVEVLVEQVSPAVMVLRAVGQWGGSRRGAVAASGGDAR